MGCLHQQAAKLEVEQPVVGRLEGVVPLTEVEGGSTAMTEGDHVAVLAEGCRPDGIWAERPQ
jgi:hypothetical protein